jgi:hypothetical protein
MRALERDRIVGVVIESHAFIRTCSEGTSSSGSMHVPDSGMLQHSTSLRWWSDWRIPPELAGPRLAIRQCNRAQNGQFAQAPSRSRIWLGPLHLRVVRDN